MAGRKKVKDRSNPIVVDRRWQTRLVNGSLGELQHKPYIDSLRQSITSHHVTSKIQKDRKPNRQLIS
jgi:hypothetical protein